MHYENFATRDRFSRVNIKDYVGITFKDVGLETLVNRAINGDKAAREEFYLRVEDIINFLADLYGRRYAKLGVDQSDLVHELFLASERCLATYDKEKGPFEFYFRAALTKQVNWYVCARYRTGEVGNSVSLSSLEENTQCLIDRSQPTSPFEMERKIELKDIVNFAGEQTTSEEFKYLSLYLKGYTISWIAQKFNTSRPTVSRRIHRALEILRKDKKDL